jgi:hypothetical protein
VPSLVGLLGAVLVAASPQCPGVAVRLVAPGLGDGGAAELSQQFRHGDGDQFSMLALLSAARCQAVPATQLAAPSAAAPIVPRNRVLAGQCLISITYPLVSALDGGGGLPRLDTSRLRATWLRDCAELLGLATFMRAAGISCSQRLGDLVAGLEPGSEADAVRLPGVSR